jgi:hypothetical protein
VLTEEDVPEFGQLVLDFLGVPLIALGGWFDSHGAEQGRGGGAGVARFTQDWMQSLVSQVMKDQVDYAPGVESLTGGRTWSIHVSPPGSSAGKLE